MLRQTQLGAAQVYNSPYLIKLELELRPTFLQGSLSTGFAVHGEALEFSMYDKRHTLSVSVA